MSYASNGAAPLDTLWDPNARLLVDFVLLLIYDVSDLVPHAVEAPQFAFKLHLG